MSLDHQHPNWPDRWSPYTDRQYIGHDMYDPYFNALLDDPFVDVDYEGHGCLDAPRELPCGSTLCIRTVGGWIREEYNRRDRECVDYKADDLARVGTAKMIKKILAEVDAEERRA